MSPEQAKGEKLDLRSDLYSVGVILYQLLTGRVPFEAENAIGVVLKHVTEDPPRPSSINPVVHPKLEAVCLKAMSKKPEDRYANARAMRADLRAAVGLASPTSSHDAALEARISMGTAKTLHALDATELVRAAEAAIAAPVLRPTSSKVTPGGTARLETAPATPSRSPIALVLAAVTALGVGVAATIIVVRLGPATTASGSNAAGPAVSSVATAPSARATVVVPPASSAHRSETTSTPPPSSRAVMEDASAATTAPPAEPPPEPSSSAPSVPATPSAASSASAPEPAPSAPPAEAARDAAAMD
jgi:serine/threonine-protein kinase